MKQRKEEKKLREKKLNLNPNFGSGSATLGFKILVKFCVRAYLQREKCKYIDWGPEARVRCFFLNFSPLLFQSF